MATLVPTPKPQGKHPRPVLLASLCLLPLLLLSLGLQAVAGPSSTGTPAIRHFSPCLVTAVEEKEDENFFTRVSAGYFGAGRVDNTVYSPVTSCGTFHSHNKALGLLTPGKRYAFSVSSNGFIASAHEVTDAAPPTP